MQIYLPGCGVLSAMFRNRDYEMLFKTAVVATTTPWVVITYSYGKALVQLSGTP